MLKFIIAKKHLQFFEASNFKHNKERKIVMANLIQKLEIMENILNFDVPKL